MAHGSSSHPSSEYTSVVDPLSDLAREVMLSRSRDQLPKRVVFLLLPNVQLLDLAGPAQVFHTASRLGAAYTLRFCAATERVISAQGLAFADLAPLPELDTFDGVIIPGIRSEGGMLSQPLLDEATIRWLRSAYQAGLPLASVCSAAFALGEAGLLADRDCTTHWIELAHLQRRFPTAHVVDNRLFVRHGTITTSAGIASGIDMALSMVEEDYGARFTAQVARCLVVYLRRDGTQPQSSIYLDYRTHLDTDVHRAQEFILDHLTERLTLETIAQAAHLSTRTLSRSFKVATGLTPVQYQQIVRLSLARTLLADSQLSVEAIAEKCGFEDGRHFRRLWKAHFGSSPAAMRSASV